MPSAETETDTEAGSEAEGAIDEGRQALLEAVTSELDEALAETYLIPGRDLWLRVDADAWADVADYLRNRQRFRFFDWLSAIDWLPSPYGRSQDAEVDKILDAARDAATADDGAEADDDADGATADDGAEADDDADGAPTGTAAGSYAGGASRFQVIARVYSLTTRLGVTVKADLGDDLTVATWTGHYPGANWHEREAHEMFGITFTDHPGLRNLYLPTGFEGYPLRKDYPLLARLVKPWPGIVDVELMPEPGATGPSTTNPGASGGDVPEQEAPNPEAGA